MTAAARFGRAMTVVLMAGALACDTAGDETGEAAAPGTEAAAPAAEVGGAGLTAVDPWVRVAIRPEGSDAPDAPPVNSAGYLVLRNAGDAADALVAVESDVAETVELHSVTMADGVMRMRQVDSVPVPASGEAALEPGGYHIMLIDLNRALEEGDTVPLTLRLRSGATLELSAPVRRGAGM